MYYRGSLPLTKPGIKPEKGDPYISNTGNRYIWDGEKWTWDRSADEIRQRHG